MSRPSLIFGLVTLAGVWLGPLPELASSSFSAHMTMHMGVVAVAAPLIAFGIAGSRLDLARNAPGLFAPLQASLLEFIVVWVWHAPVLHHAARHSTTGFALEQAAFVITGLYMWLSVFGGGPSGRADRRGAGVAGLLLTSMHMTLLGALLALSPRPLYHHAASMPWLTPLADQHLGGAIMLLVGGISYLAGGLWLMGTLLRDSGLKGEERA